MRPARPLALLAAGLLAAPAAAQAAGRPAFLWLRDHRDGPPPAAWLEACRGAALEARTPAAWLLDERRPPELDLYLGHAAGRDELHLDRGAPAWAEGRAAYLEARDPAAWPRAFDPFAPDAFGRLEAALVRTRERFGPGPFRAVSLGDEVALTPFGDPAEHGASAHEREAWRRWLGRGGGAAHGLALDAELPGTERVLRDGSERAFAAFLARRRFERETFSGLLARLADRAAELWDGAPIALLGLGGESAWHGLDLGLLADRLDVLEPYDQGHAVALCRGLRRLGDGRPALWRTVFLEGLPAADVGPAVRRASSSPADALVLWSDRALAGAPDRAAALAEALDLWRAAPPAPAPPARALLHDFDSLCRGWFLDARRDGASWPERLGGYQAEHGTLERAQRSWLEAHPTAAMVPLARLGPAVTAVFPELVAIELRVLDDAELAALEAHLTAGGTLDVQGELGLLRPDGSAWEGSIEARLRERFPHAVRRTR